jgi:hypothetical protein
MRGPTEPLPYFALVALLLLIVHSRLLETCSGNSQPDNNKKINNMCTVYTHRHTHDVEYSWRDDGLAVTKRHILFLFFSFPETIFFKYFTGSFCLDRLRLRFFVVFIYF